MNPSGEAPKVVDLQEHLTAQVDAGDRLGELLRKVRNAAQNRLSSLVSTLFENVDDALFDLAEKAESNAVQTRFFDGMREIRKKRQLVERRFHEQVVRTFAAFAVGELKPVNPEPTFSGNARLALVDDRELEESLAVSSMVSKTESRLLRGLYQANQRLAVIVGGTRVDNATNPIGPAMLCQGFRKAVSEFDLAIQVKLIIYKLFDRYVLAGLDALYDEVNGELIRAGVLPQIRHRVPHGSHAQPALARGSAHSASSGSDAQAHDESDARNDATTSELQVELYNTVCSLLARRHESPAYAPRNPGQYARGAAAGDDDSWLSPTTLLSALNVLQGQARSTSEPLVAGNAEIVLQLKRELYEEARRFDGRAKAARASAADEDTIDLVGMLFEYILQDRNLPAQIQALLGRLQIPYLKVAIVDKHLFAQKSHPARQLLDLLAEAGLGWSEEADADHRLIERIKQSVTVILRNFDDDVSVFESELSAFGEFMDRHRRRSRVAEQRASETARGREKLHAARHTVAREIVQCIGERQLPAVVRAVLARPWANYLVLTLLRNGLGSEEWNSGLHFAAQFVWSALPKTTDSDRARLRELLPWVEETLRHGLITVAYQDNDLIRLMQQLSHLYRQLLGDESITLGPSTQTGGEAGSIKALNTESPAADGDRPGDTSVSASIDDLPTIDGAIEEIILASASAEQEGPIDSNEPEDEFLQSARAMKVGTWLEFVDEAGNRERAKLSWISPISSRYLFVNRRGLKICDKTVYALAAELRCGASTILADVPLFDRALGAIVERLRQAHADGKSNPPPAPSPTG
ncbi:MAG: DUF1631 domain-containing protein [Rhodanobacteraceae bacterium]